MIRVYDSYKKTSIILSPVKQMLLRPGNVPYIARSIWLLAIKMLITSHKVTKFSLLRRNTQQAMYAELH